MSQEKADTGSSNKKNPLNPTIFLDFDIDRKPAGRIVFELFKDVCPQTVENFRGLCTGEYGTGKSGRPLCLRHSVVYRVSEGSFESGDIVNGTGTGGESIYGPYFADEGFTIPHDQPGMLSMSTTGPNTNNSKFNVSFRAQPYLDRKTVVFGRVIEGMEVVKIIERYRSITGEPSVIVTLGDCGQIS